MNLSCLTYQVLHSNSRINDIRIINIIRKSINSVYNETVLFLFPCAKEILLLIINNYVTRASYSTPFVHGDYSDNEQRRHGYFPNASNKISNEVSPSILYCKMQWGVLMGFDLVYLKYVL